MRLLRRVGSGTASFFTLVASVAAVATAHDERPRNVSTFDPAQHREGDLAAWNTFNGSFGDQWRVDWNHATGTPHRVYGHFLMVRPPRDEKAAATISRRLLSDLAPVLGITPRQLKLGRVDFDAPSNPEAGGGTWYISYRQTYRKLPVEGGSVRMVIRGDRLTGIGSDFYRGIRVSPRPSLMLEEALEHIDRGEDAVKPVESRLIVYPVVAGGPIRHHLAWDVTLPVEAAADGTARPVQWRYVLDAHDGAVLERENRAKYADVSGRVTGLVYPRDPRDAQQVGPISGLTVRATQAASSFTAVTDSDGRFTLGSLSAGPVDIDSHLEGPHLRVWNAETADPDATHRATVSAPGTHDWDWAVDDPSPQDVETHTFYHMSRIQEWFLRGDPFDVRPRPDPMPVTVRVRFGSSGFCDAGALPWGIEFGACDTSFPDVALCADVVYHEYTHRVVGTLYEDAGLRVPYFMQEGIADYFGATVVDAPDWGAGCYAFGGRNLDTPDRRFPDDATGLYEIGVIFAGALWDARAVLGAPYVDSLTMRAVKRVETQFDGFLGAFLEEDDDPAVSSDPGRANNNPTDGTPNADAICDAFFVQHGVFHEYCTGQTSTPVALITTPDPTTGTRYDASLSTVAIVGSAAGSRDSPLVGFVLEYAHHETPSVWRTAGITLAGGGVEVLDGPLGTLSLSGLVEGLYVVRLTVTTLDGSTDTATTHLLVDRSSVPGWPRPSLVSSFRGSAAIVDLQPAVPGLEVVAVEWDDPRIHVWHANGDVAAGWPQPVVSTDASPAVGDLDGDGDLEVVLQAGRGVYAFDHGGGGLTGWPQSIGPDWPVRHSTTALADVDGLGGLEIVVGSEDGRVYAWHYDGLTVRGAWPVPLGAPVRASPAVADLDGDGAADVVIGASDGSMHVLDGTGAPKPGWPIRLAATTSITGSAALGDLDNDGDLEIVVATEDTDVPANRRVHAWHHDGGTVTGWPQPIASPPVDGGFQRAPASAVLADLDANGDLEVVIRSQDGDIHVWRGNGTRILAWPPAGLDTESLVRTGSSPIVADLDGDGDGEVVFAGRGFAGADVGPIYAYHHGATPVAGWPRFSGLHRSTSPAIADLTGDGVAELVMPTNSGVFVWELPGPFGRAAGEWPLYRGDNRRTGTYGPRGGVALLIDTSGSMSWRPDGLLPAPGEEHTARLALSRSAASAFLDLLGAHGRLETRFGIATFPEHPSRRCSADVVSPMTLVDNASTAGAITTTLPGLRAENGTPLLAGVRESIDLLGAERRGAIVLLSDGYHNCPGLVSPVGSEVTGLIDDLGASETRVFSIGFGRPSDVDHPLLEALANQTTPPGFAGSQFHDVTTPSFDPGAWDPATALQAAYKSVLVDALGLQTISDPLARIAGGALHSYPAPLTSFDSRVSFFVAWKTPKRDRLQVSVSASDGRPVSAGAPGVRVRRGDTYTIVTVTRAFLSHAGAVDFRPWTLDIRARPFSGDEPYLFSIIADSTLTLEAGTDRRGYGTRDLMQVTARLRLEGQPLTGLEDVRAVITGPEEGIGNWLVQNSVSQEELAQVPRRLGGERLAPWQRKAHYLSTVRRVAFPGARQPELIHLHDDGTHGDLKAHDGVYTNAFANTEIPGTYGIHVLASGMLKDGQPFARDAGFQRRMHVVPSPDATSVEVVRRRGRRTDFSILPRDQAGNALGPGYRDRLSLKLSDGYRFGRFRDALDGRYLVPVWGLPHLDPSAVRLELLPIGSPQQHPGDPIPPPSDQIPPP